MRPPLPPTYTSELTGQNRRIGSLEKSQVPRTGQSRQRAELRVHAAHESRALVALNVAEETGIDEFAGGFSTYGIYWSDWYVPTTPVVFDRLTIEGPGIFYESDTPPDRWRVSIELANPSSVLAPQVTRGATYQRDYRPGDDQNTVTVTTFDVPYPSATTQPIVVKLPSPVLVTQHQQIRVVRWHQTWDPTTNPTGPIATYGTRWPITSIWDTDRTDTRTYDLFRYVTDVSWKLTGEASRTTTAEVQSVAGRLIERQGMDGTA